MTLIDDSQRLETARRLLETARDGQRQAEANLRNIERIVGEAEACFQDAVERMRAHDDRSFRA